MNDNIIKFRPKKYGVDYHREEMERCDAGISVLCSPMASRG